MFKKFNSIFPVFAILAMALLPNAGFSEPSVQVEQNMTNVLDNPLTDLPQFEGVYIRVGDRVEKMKRLTTHETWIGTAYAERQIERVRNQYASMRMRGITFEDYANSIHIGRKNDAGILIPPFGSVSIIVVGRSGNEVESLNGVGLVQDYADSVKRVKQSGFARSVPGRIIYDKGVPTPLLDTFWGWRADIFKTRFLNDLVTEYIFDGLDPCQNTTSKDLNTEQDLPNYGLIIGMKNNDKYLFSCLNQSLSPWNRGPTVSAQEAQRVFETLNTPFD
jgi:hypothetical protein